MAPKKTAKLTKNKPRRSKPRVAWMVYTPPPDYPTQAPPSNHINSDVVAGGVPEASEPSLVAMVATNLDAAASLAGMIRELRQRLTSVNLDALQAAGPAALCYGGPKDTLNTTFTLLCDARSDISQINDYLFSN